MKKVWLFSRLSEFIDNESIKRTMDVCRNKALEKGYTVVKETMIIGSSELARAAVKDIIGQNSKYGAVSIFSINGNSLSRDLKTAQEIYQYILDNGMRFESSGDDVYLLDKNNPVGAVFNLLATGQKQFPEDFPFEEADEFIDEDETSLNEPMGQTM